MKAIARAGGVLLLLLLAAAWASWYFGRCLVKVTNAGRTALSEVAVGDGAERHFVGAIKSGESVIFRFYPRGESSATLNARRQDGTVVTASSYVEPGGYRLHYTIDDSTAVRSNVGMLRFR